jgi:phosphatidylserine/phosphatidylglycerophosphate/cardiolipin synthase-like enzyme
VSLLAYFGTSGVTRSGPLIVEPGAGFSPVYSLLDGARHSIDMTMYEFSDTAAQHDLAAAARRGVRVRVILDRRARSVNSDAYSYSPLVPRRGDLVLAGLPLHPPEDRDHRHGKHWSSA